MKQMSDAFAAHVRSGVTTLAFCWIIRRNDGAALGFTDHDQPLRVNGTSCEPETGLSGSESRQSDGFASDDQDVTGILSSDRITRADLEAGRYDGAVIETWRVNWAEPDQCLLLRAGYLGEIKQKGDAFQAEIRGYSSAMEQEQGRIYQYTCDATFCDSRCGLDSAADGFSFQGTIDTVQSATMLLLNLNAAPLASALALGRLEMLSGGASGMVFDILTHQKITRDGASFDQIEVWLPLHQAITPGDRVSVRIGCDKRFETCRNQFANQLNFQGFPHIPGNDFILSYPLQDGDNEGAALIS